MDPSWVRLRAPDGTEYHYFRMSGALAEKNGMFQPEVESGLRTPVSQEFRDDTKGSLIL